MLLLALAVARPAMSATQQPCETAASSPGPLTISPINGTLNNGILSTYCQSAYGWSDTWFVKGQPANYSGALDVLSGDDAPGIIGLTNSNPYKMFTPYLDRGTYNAQNIGTSWTIVNNVAIAGNTATSTIQLAGIRVKITTTLNGGFTERLDITNTTSAAISNLRVFDYFNFHPNGGTNATVTSCSTATGTATAITITGVSNCNGNGWRGNGMMTGTNAAGQLATAAAWQVGTVTQILNALSTNTFTNNTSAGPGDVAGVLVWNLGTIAAGASTSFTINKFIVPEPGTLGLLAFGVVGLALFRASRRA